MPAIADKLVRWVNPFEDDAKPKSVIKTTTTSPVFAGRLRSRDDVNLAVNVGIIDSPRTLYRG